VSDRQKSAELSTPTPEELQLLQMQQVIAQRGAATFGMFVDGISYMLDAARQGDRSARRALLQLRAALLEMERTLGITLPGDL
jgi:hypothetical protein